MNIHDIKENILNLYNDSQLLAEEAKSAQLMGHLKILTNLLSFLESTANFVKDAPNIHTLQEYSEKYAQGIRCPLGKLSSNIANELNELSNLLNIDISNFLTYKESSKDFHNINSVISKIITKLNTNNFKNLLSAYSVLQHLAGHNKTLIILGPNGSGKTSFANHIKNLENNVKVIPASKPIKALGYMPSLYGETLQSFNNTLYSGHTLNEDVLQKLIIGLCKEHDDIARKYYDTKTTEKDSIYNKVKNIFDEFFEVKLDNSEFSEKKMKAKKGIEPPFDFNDMSDGERVAFFYIATVMAAPDQAFIIVDEPENHLNPAIYNKIWDKLIDVRDDCQFIFISHTIDFIRARTNFELVKIKKFVHPNDFDFEFLGCSLEDIQTEHLVEIIGSRKTILFCEGTKTDYDYKVYEKLFGEKFTVIATGSCISVANSVIACNKHAQTYSIQSAVGIIDSDLKSEESLANLKKQSIFSLKCNEIEMLLLDEFIFKAVLEHTFKEPQLFEQFKDEFFNKLNNRKEHIISRLVKTQVDDKLRSSVIDDKQHKTKEEIKDNLHKIFTKIDIDNIWNTCDEQVSNIIERKNYDEALKFCCLGHGEIINGIANRFVPRYSELALGLLGSNKNLANNIRNKYFPELSS
ncbi:MULTISPECIES: AAA family ATPase [Desulfovibrio]|uniref:AAA family ATPase n=1 Tax=Desulfovibrio TaxID=872 RepID=UPI0026E9FD1D|nr:AAA family ATPase [Desulfovibrio piger]